tara:strand:- start:55 stop:231 length:177 start_codon:yes stop_codon:yes gene_type:complete
MENKSKSPEFIQGSFFEDGQFFSEGKPKIAFSALRQIQRLRAKNNKKDALSILKEWMI